MKTRFLQLSLTTMLEYNIEEENKEVGEYSYSKFILTELLDNHYLMFSPCSYEVKYNDGDNYYEKLPMNNKNSNKKFITLNTLNHTAVPTNKKDSEWFFFVDNDYKYVPIVDNINANPDYLVSEKTYDKDNIKCTTYLDYCKDPINNQQGFYEDDFENNIVWDNIKLYFTSGYDFSDIYGALFRIYVETDYEKYLDLCNIVFTKSNVYKYITYMSKPIIFGNAVYDKYLSIKVISLKTIQQFIKNKNDSDNHQFDFLKVKEGSPIKLLFSYIENENFTLEQPIYPNSFKINNPSEIITDNTNCYFTRTSSIRGTIPKDKINSDNIGLYISSVPNYPYIEFYGMWKGTPLTSAIVHKFNVTIPLYNSSIIRKQHTYEVSRDYVAEYDVKKWIAMHEIEANILEEDSEIAGKFNVIKSETYTQSQFFIYEKNEMTKFYYRPVIFDDNISLKIAKGECAMAIKYTLRLMNIEDSVQFIKSGSITLEGSQLSKFCFKTTSLNFSDRLPYKIYNKIIENKQTVNSPVQNGNGLTKYVKHFYDSTTIVLDDNGEILGNKQYTLSLSQVPKDYKFVFKRQSINNNLEYIDLSDSYYKLFAYDSYGGEIIIEPTYSNMNLLLGELEFNIGSADLYRLKEVPEENRKMTIVVYNVDNTTSAMYDFYYTF